MAGLRTDKAGQRNTLVTIQQITAATPDAAGEPQLTWGTYTTAWASVSAMPGSEVFEADRVAARQAFRVELLYNATTRLITTKMRLSFGGRTMNIESAADPDGRRIHIVLLCREAERVVAA